MTSQSTIDRIIGDENVKNALFGEIEVSSDFIQTYEEYDNIYRIRHDSIHSILCDQLSIEFGEKRVEETLKESKVEIIRTRYFDQVKEQTPDYMSIRAGVADIIEITVSTDLNARRRKESKYALLMYFLKQNDIKVNYRVLVVNPQDIYSDRAYMIQTFKLDETHIDLMKKICDNTNKLLREVHRTTRGSEFYRRRFDIDSSEVKLDLSKDDVINTHESHQNKCFHKTDDLVEILNSKDRPMINESDSDFLNDLIKQDVKSEFEETEVFDEDAFMRKLGERSNSTRVRSVLPIPLFQLAGVDSAVRSTENDFTALELISSLMGKSDNSVVNRIGCVLSNHLRQISKKDKIENEDFLFHIKFSDEEAYDIALDGPGRKKFIRRGSAKHIESQADKDFYCLKPTTDVNDLETLSYFFSQKDRINTKGSMLDDMSQLSEIRGNGFDFVKICQSIYREVNINSMRGDRRHKMIVKPTGIEGLFVCLYPGTKLRCGELANNVWFKIIADNSFVRETGEFMGHWGFKRLIRDNNVSFSKWLSCDVHRLDHYIRSYDKILMSYTSMMSARFKTVVDLAEFSKEEKSTLSLFSESETHHPLYKLINEDTTNALGLIILTYLEDRRVTSKMLQNVRYIVMSSISIFPKMKSAMNKLIEPVRSPLQLYYIKRLISFVNQMKRWDPSKNSAFGHVKYDSSTQMFSDRLGGSNIRMPRPLLSSGSTYGEFSEILCEMYFTMLFNKNQDDPTHASFQILEKILEGEESFQRSKQQNDHLGYRGDMSDSDFAIKILREKNTHKFSRRAIEIGSRLLREELADPLGDQISSSIKRKNVNKTLDQFATFKSSSENVSEFYNPQIGKQTSRTKCIGACFKLLDGGYKTSFDIIEAKKLEETSYQVFKKNQIGGVREILILPLTVRIRINVLETISRNICHFDNREMLTHGSKKFDRVKSILYSSKKYSGSRAPIHITMDKSRWGPSFVPIQFLYLFTSFRERMGNVFNFISDILIRHQNKTCVLPDRLMKAWYLDEDNKYHHGDDKLQRLKEIFLRERKTSMKNESNMGQGILHFTSSYLHLTMIAFRNELYSRMCKNHNIDSKDHDDLLSSDDSYTIFCPELFKNDKVHHVKLKLSLFLKSQQIAEYLFNCRTSMVKSSINPLIGEFNSLFVSNMSFMPALLKFSLSSVHPVNTDSFYRMVKESYSSSRQIVENGGTMDLYLLSSLLNKRYCEEIYHTNTGGQNDLSKLGIRIFSYQLGTYPIFNPSLMLMFGPEYYNYKLYRTKWSDMNDDERKLFIVSHKMVKGGLIETLAEFEDGDTVLGGLLRIEAKMGPVKQLQRFRSLAKMEKKDLEGMLEENPILLIQKPKTSKEIEFRITQKLYTTGSSEALKNLAASIYYGRVSATVSAKVFYIPGTDSDETKTYFECVQSLLKEGAGFDIEKQIRFLYPKGSDYDVFLNHDDQRFDYSARNPFEIQTIQTLATHKIHSKLTQSVEDLLSYKWLKKNIPIDIEQKVGRDFDIIKLHYPMIKDTMQETLDVFDGEKKQQIKGLLLLILKLYSLRDKSFKGVIYGFGSQDLVHTFDTLEELNQSSSLKATRDQIKIKEERKFETYEKIYLAHNHTICSMLNKVDSKASPWETIKEEDINIFLQDNSINKKIRKRIFMLALHHGYINNVEIWSGRVGVIMHSWSRRQRYYDGKYVGDYEVVMFLGKYRLTVSYKESQNRFRLYKTDFDDPELLHSLLREFCELLSLTLDDLIKKIEYGNWIVTEDKIIHVKNSLGFCIHNVSILDTLMFDKCHVESDMDRTVLYSNDYKILSLDTGILTSYAIPTDDMDFRSFGLSFKKMCRIGVFNQDFNVLYKTKQECLDALDDINVPKPKITQATIDRLKLRNWDEIRVEEGVRDIIIEDMTGFYKSMMDEDIELTEDALIDDPISSMIQHIEKTDLVTSIMTTQRIVNTRKILWNIYNLKYNLICHQVLSDMRISKGTMQNIGSFVTNGNRKNIMLSLISLYDRTYQHDGQASPKIITLGINKDFIQKFNIRAQGEDDDISID